MSEWKTAGKVRMTPKGVHDSTIAYNILDLVSNEDYTMYYIAKQDVPADTLLTNTDYWDVVTDVSEIPDQISEIEDDVTELKSAIEQIEPGLSDDAKIALLNCFQHVAWVDEHGQNYYDALYAALYPSEYPRIVATYAPGSHIVYDTDTLDSLKSYLTVTYFENAESSGVVLSSSEYTLSGSLYVGTSTIDVHYEDLSTSFTVNVATHTLYSLPANTTFDGTSESDIDTGLSLLESDISFSIMFKATVNVNSQDSVMRVIFFIRDGSEGFALNGNLTKSNSDITNYNDYIRAQSGSSWSIGNHTVACALSHVAGTSTWEAALKIDDKYGIKKSNPLAYTYVGGNYHLFIGCGYNWITDHYNRYNRMKGTIHEFKVLDYALTQSEINQYVG